jgi:hypothetical protein
MIRPFRRLACKSDRCNATGENCPRRFIVPLVTQQRSKKDNRCSKAVTYVEKLARD